MTFEPEAVLKALRQRDLKITPQRRLILEILKDNHTHPSAEDIFQQVKERLPNTSFTTIYNTLDMLRDLGHIREVAVESDRRRFDPNTHPHQHFVCAACGAVEDIPVDASDLAGRLARHRPDLSVRLVDVVFHGHCPTCRTDSH